MALQGTLDTFALPDVLRLLASTKKTGRLVVRGNRGDGSLWFQDGAVVASAADRIGPSSADGEVVFELLRFAEGSFTFEADSPAPEPHKPSAVEPLLVDAEHLLAEWAEIEAVVPSLDCWVSLCSEIAGDTVTIDAPTWTQVVAIGGGTPVHGLAATLGLGELDVCRAVRTLVLAGLASVGTAPAVSTPPPPAPAPVQVAAAPPEEPAGRPSRLMDLDPPAERPGYGRPRASEPDEFAIEIPGVAPIVAADPPPAPPPPARRSGSAVKPAPAKAAPAAADPEPAEADEVARQLASLSPKAARAVAAAARAGTAEEREAALAEAIDDEDEPINRGLLLKFLSSVRS